MAMEQNTLEAECDEEYIDVKFESMVDDVEQRMRQLRAALDSGSSQIEKHLDEVCIAILQAKFQYAKVLESYGTSYRDKARHFVDLAHAAADLAHHTPFADRTKLLQRHADEIKAERTKQVKLEREQSNKSVTASPLPR